MTRFFSSATAVTKFQQELPQRGVKYTGCTWEPEIFDRICRLSRKWFTR